LAPAASRVSAYQKFLLEAGAGKKSLIPIGSPVLPWIPLFAGNSPFEREKKGPD
jgi:hypothetical protein